MNTDPHWTAYVSALAVPVVTLLGALIAGLQWKLARNKLKFDLFERRMKVYDASTLFVANILMWGKVKDEELRKFLVNVREAKNGFLTQRSPNTLRSSSTIKP